MQIRTVRPYLYTTVYTTRRERRTFSFWSQAFPSPEMKNRLLTRRVYAQGYQGYCSVNVGGNGSYSNNKIQDSQRTVRHLFLANAQITKNDALISGTFWNMNKNDGDNTKWKESGNLIRHLKGESDIKKEMHIMRCAINIVLLDVI